MTQATTATARRSALALSTGAEFRMRAAAVRERIARLLDRDA